MLRLLIAGNVHFNERELEFIKHLGYVVDVQEQEKQLLSSYNYDVIICNFLFINYDIKRFKNLKAVQLLSAGLDRMPMDYAEKHHIEVKNARGIYSIPIAEFVVMTALDVYKESFFFYENQKEHRWEKQRSLDELSDKTVCVFGTGSVGTEVAKRFGPFTEEIIGVDLQSMQSPFFKEIYGLNRAKEILSISDIIVLTLPLTTQTYHMFGEEFLSAMKDEAVIINVARGGLIDEKELKRKLAAGKFKSVVLDVFEKEPLDEQYWGWDAKRVRIIPHNSFISGRNEERMKKMIMSNLKDWAARLNNT